MESKNSPYCKGPAKPVAGGFDNGRLKVSITTFGCKSNRYDSSALEDILTGAGMETVPSLSYAGAYIINTCTVTGKTDRQARQLIRRVRNINPEAVVIVTGCYAQVSPEEVGRIDGVDYILGNPDKEKVLECVLKGRRGGSPVTMVGDFRAGTPFTLRARTSSGRTRANLKVQEGCDRGCSYCIIPRARGVGRSLPLKEVEKEMDALVDGGFLEIVLTGIHLGAYGRGLAPPLELASVLKLIEKRGYPCRFRLSSLDPDEVTDELIEIMSGAKSICNHLHLPLQSGDDTVIRNMKRPYTGALFAEKAAKLASSVREISIGVDVMAGFPGEGEREFENTFSLLRDLPVSYMHIFPFSKRRGTLAAGYGAEVSPGAIKDRCRRLKALDGLKRAAFHESFIGKPSEVLVELARDEKTGLLKGRARNYIQVSAEGEDSLKNTLVKVRLSGIDENGMRGVAG